VLRGGFNAHHARYISDAGWAGVFAQTGLLGVIGLVFLGVGLTAGVRRSWGRPSDAIPAMGAVALLVLGMLATSSLTYKPTSSLFWVVVGLTLTKVRDVDGGSG